MNFKVFTNSEYFLPVAVACLVISISLILYFTMKKESLGDVAPPPPAADIKIEIPQEAMKQPAVPQENTTLSPTEKHPEIKTEITPADLLPSSSDVKDFETKFPSGQGAEADKNFLIAGFNIGINTIGSSLKNANLQLRSDPYIPRRSIGPWNDSTIMSSDLTNRRTLEIGS
jgi:hypothetical protein